ncbi:phage holin family protein [Nocardia sp. NPDC048505]|uniref:phage holin family protein n=1 Tax=unclassified Nocardia TaxID=2637762 RepID=UPI0033D032E2
MTETRSVPPEERRTIAELVNDATEQLNRLIRDEIQLAKLELVDKGKRAGRGAGLAGIGAVLAFYGGAALIAAVVLALAIVLPAWAAALIVGVVLLAGAGLLAFLGQKNVRQAVPPLPEEAVAGVKRDIDSIKDGSKR